MTVFKRASTILVCFLVGTINGDITQNTRVIEEGSCQHGDHCTAEVDDSNKVHEKYKYSTDVQHAIKIFKDTVDDTREPSEEELEAILFEMNVKEPDEAENDYDIAEDLEEAKTEATVDGVDKKKYSSDIQHARKIFKVTVDDTREPSEEELEAILFEMNVKEPDEAESDYDIAEDLEEAKTEATGDSVVKEADQENENGYEFPRLVKLEPGNVGDVETFEVDNEYFYKRRTMSVRPPVFEIPDFLSAEECDYIIEAAKKNGLDQSNLFGAEIKDELNKNRNNSDISRVSDQTWLRRSALGEEFWAKLNIRLSSLTMLDIGIINRSEPMQVVSYVPGGHYHAHLDTVESSDLPCCFQTHCGEKEETAAWSQCCRLCRYITVLYYLNDVEAGGETVFPLADMPDELYNEKMTNLPAQKWYNLSLYCHNSSLIVSPKRGTAIFWYSHFVDEQTGYLGPVDQRSHHGGCDLLKGNKWIANSWISGTTYRDRFKPGVFYTP